MIIFTLRKRFSVCLGQKTEFWFTFRPNFINQESQSSSLSSQINVTLSTNYPIDLTNFLFIVYPSNWRLTLDLLKNILTLMTCLKILCSKIFGCFSRSSKEVTCSSWGGLTDSLGRRSANLFGFLVDWLLVTIELGSSNTLPLLLELNRLLGVSVNEGWAKVVSCSSSATENIRNLVVSNTLSFGVVDNMAVNSDIRASSSSLQFSPDPRKIKKKIIFFPLDLFQEKGIFISWLAFI